MTGYLNLLLRLTVWFLLTADLSPINVIIGVVIAFLLPVRCRQPGALRDWLDTIGRILLAIPRAYFEAIQMILFPHRYEDITRMRVKPDRTPGLIFLDIFLITFTPKTLVLKYHESGWYDIHRLKRRKTP
jgi:multicomponent Na+:H+ antiporter subunit E